MKKMKLCEKDTQQLLLKYEPFINKYLYLFHAKNIDFNNYDIRFFLSCYIKDKSSRSRLRKKSYRKKSDIALAHKVLNYLCQAFKDHNKQELYHELIIPFLSCLKRYEERDVGFQKYIYVSYKYELIRHINKLLFQNFKTIPADLETVEVKTENENDFMFLDAEFELNHPDWLRGKTCMPIFKNLTREDRLILIKYYLESYSDKKIGQLIGKSRKTINRTRHKAISKIKNETG